MRIFINSPRKWGQTQVERSAVFYDVYIAQQRWNDHTASSCACTPGQPRCKKGKIIRREYFRLRAVADKVLNDEALRPSRSRVPEQKREGQ